MINNVLFTITWLQTVQTEALRGNFRIIFSFLLRKNNRVRLQKWLSNDLVWKSWSNYVVTAWLHTRRYKVTVLQKLSLKNIHIFHKCVSLLMLCLKLFLTNGMFSVRYRLRIQTWNLYTKEICWLPWRL